MDATKRKKIILDYYNQYAQKYGKEYETTIAGRYFLKKKIQIALKMCELNTTHHILDAGCANGYYTLDLAKKGFRVTGIDLSPKNIKECKRRVKELNLDNVDFFVADLENLKNIKDNQFDCIISFAALRYVPNVMKAMKELYRITKKRGCILIDLPNKYSPWFIIFQRFAHKYILPQDKECDIHYTRKETKEFVENVGFKDIRVKVDFWIARTTPNYMAYPFIFLDKIMSKLPLINRMGGAIMVRGIKK